MAQVLSNNTNWLLSQWASWSRRGNGEPRGYGEGVMFQEVLRLTRAKPLLIADEDALLIDRIVVKLTLRDSEMATALIVYHFSDGNASHVARVLSAQANEKINRKRVDVLVKSGTAWVDACLCMECEVA